MSLIKEREMYPTLQKQIDGLKRLDIICLNAIAVRDFNKIEKVRITINTQETELKEAQNKYDEDQKRLEKAKKIKEVENNVESEEK